MATNDRTRLYLDADNLEVRDGPDSVTLTVKDDYTLAVGGIAPDGGQAWVTTDVTLIVYEDAARSLLEKLAAAVADRWGEKSPRIVSADDPDLCEPCDCGGPQDENGAYVLHAAGRHMDCDAFTHYTYQALTGGQADVRFPSLDAARIACRGRLSRIRPMLFEGESLSLAVYGVDHDGTLSALELHRLTATANGHDYKVTT